MEATLYIGNEGWTGKTVHAIRAKENGHYVNNDKVCYNFAALTQRPITHLKKVQATTENVTCKNCLKHIN